MLPALAPESTPDTRSKLTPVVLSGLMISSSHPPGVAGEVVGLASSPKMMVPHAVALTGSQEVVPVTMVSTAPSESRIRTRPGWAVPSSLQAMIWVGLLGGHRAIMSMFGGRFGFALNTRGMRALWRALRDEWDPRSLRSRQLSVDEAATGETMPNNCSECASSCLSRNSPKLNVAIAAALVANNPATNRVKILVYTFLLQNDEYYGPIGARYGSHWRSQRPEGNVSWRG